MLHRTNFHCIQDLDTDIITPQNLLCRYCRFRGTHSEDRFTSFLQNVGHNTGRFHGFFTFMTII
jgi:hypothetical protein